MHNTILLIDPNEESLESRRAELEANHYRVMTASSIQKAKEMIRREIPDAIMFDDMTGGFEKERLVLIHFIKKDPRYRNIPLIFSNEVSPEGLVLNEGKYDAALPVDVFLKKPLSPQQLIKQLENLGGGS